MSEPRTFRRHGTRVVPDPELIDELWKRALEGKSCAQLAKQAGVSSTWLSTAFRKTKGSLLEERTRIREELLESLWQRALAGEPAVALAEEVGVCAQWLSTEWKARGHELAKERRKKKDVVFEAAHARWVAGERLEDIGKDIGISRSALLKAFGRRDLFRYPVLTGKTLRGLWERRKRGERVKVLAAEAGITRSALTNRWRQMGFDPSSMRHRHVTAKRDPMYRRAFCLRQDGLLWAEIAEEVGYPGNPQSLRGRVRAWKIRNEIVSRP